MPNPVKQIVLALSFYPRGGSAQVVRYLSRRLARSFATRLYTGSLGAPGDLTHAGTFFAGMDPIALDYSGAHRQWQGGRDPLLADPPMHGSFEDRPGVPDVFLAKLSPEMAGRQVATWGRIFSVEEDEPQIAHLHHLTPLHEPPSTSGTPQGSLHTFTGPNSR